MATSCRQIPAALRVRTAAQEPIFHSGERKVEILVARNEITITRAEYAAGAVPVAARTSRP